MLPLEWIDVKRRNEKKKCISGNSCCAKKIFDHVLVENGRIIMQTDVSVIIAYFIHPINHF